MADNITYIDNGVVFIGSKIGDSQLVKVRGFNNLRDMVDNKGLLSVAGRKSERSRLICKYSRDLHQFGSYIGHAGCGYREAGTRTSRAMIYFSSRNFNLESCVLKLITCSGSSKNGSLRIIRSGIGIHESANIELPGVKGKLESHTSRLDFYL